MINTGYTIFEITVSQIYLIRSCKKNDLHCYQVKYKNNTCTVGFPIYEKKKVKQIFPNAIECYTSGISGMLWRNLTRKSRVISYVLVICLWCLYSTTLFQINVYGESDKLDKALSQHMKKYEGKQINVPEMKASILDTFRNDVSWLEVYQKGSIVNVRYARKLNLKSSESKNHPLIAKKDGMIAYFKCREGNRIKKINEMVKKGEVLVDNMMVDSYNKPIATNVEGQVYAYTWNEVHIEVDDNKLPEAINYFSLLLQARDEVHIDLIDNEKIVKENVLQFNRNNGKIVMKVLYTLLEDITT